MQCDAFLVLVVRRAVQYVVVVEDTAVSPAWRVTRIAPGMSSGFTGASSVEDSARWSGVRGTLCEPGTMYKQLSLRRALNG